MEEFVHRRLQGGAGVGGGYGGRMGSGKRDDALGEWIVRGMIRVLGPEITMLLGVSFMVFVLIASWKEGRRVREKIERQRRENREWAKAAPHGTGTTTVQFPLDEGADFKGYYRQYGQDHSLFSFSMTFKHHTVERGVGDLAGHGRDKVGRYKINGIFNCYTGRLAFTKKYYRDCCCNSNQNLGHEVEYVGCVQGCLAAGIRGSWFVATHQYKGSGDFHIWPTQPVQSSFHRQPLATHVGKEAAIFMASDDNECVVCFDASVNSVIRPCGHISMCTHCAEQVTRCPICRGYIDSIQPYAPSASFSSA